MQVVIPSCCPPVLSTVLSSLHLPLSHLTFLALTWAEGHASASVRAAAIRLLQLFPRSVGHSINPETFLKKSIG